MNTFDRALRDDLGTAPSPPALGALRTRVRRRRARRRIATVALATAVATGVVVGVTSLSNGSGDTRRDRVVAAGGGTARALRSERVDARLAWLDRDGIAIADARTGRVLHRVPGTGPLSCRMCFVGFTVGRDVVFGDGSNIRLVSPNGAARTLAPGRFAFPAADAQSIYVVPDADGSAVERWDLHGHKVGGPWRLPSGYVLSSASGFAARAVVGGVIVETAENGTDHRLAIWTPSTNALRVIGQNRWDVIDTYTAPGAATSTIAWIEPGCAFPGCAIALTDSATGATRTIAPPPGHTGFFIGGAFSPDGRLLAVFPSTTPAPPSGRPVANPSLDLAVIDVASGNVTAVRDSHLFMGEPIGQAAWSPSGDWLFFGVGDRILVHRSGTDDAVPLPMRFSPSARFAVMPVPSASGR